MIKKIVTLMYISLFFVSTTNTSAAASASASISPFDKGSSNLVISAGSGSAFSDDYIILGLGYGYYLANGFQLGIKFDFWLDGSPSIYQVTPDIQYVFHCPQSIQLQGSLLTNIPYLQKLYVGLVYIQSFSYDGCYTYQKHLLLI